jgi:hypothetical protein
MPATEVFVALAALFPVLYASALVHEAGHAACARLVGGMPSSFGLGLGRLFFVGSLGRSRVYFGARKPFQGIAFSLYPQLLPERWRQVGVLAGGIAANALTAVVSLALVGVLPGTWPVLYTSALVNALLALSNGFPFSVRIGPLTLRSDGAQILQTLLGRRRTEPGDLFRTLHLLSGLWRESGDLRTLRYYTAAAAAMWNELGDAARARELLEEARDIAADPLPPFRAYEKLVAAEATLAEGDPRSAGSQLDAAEADFRGLDHPAGLLLAGLIRGRLLVRLGDKAGALDCYEALAANPILRWQRPLRSLVQRQICCCRHELPGGGGIDASLAAYEALPPRERTPLQDRVVYTEVAEARGRAGRHEEAAAAYGRALDAAAALDRTLSEPDRDRFRSAQAGLIRAAQENLRAAGKEEDAARLDSFFAAAAEKDQRLASEKEARVGRVRLRRGLALTVFNVAVAVAAVALALHLWPVPGRPASAPGGLLVAGWRDDLLLLSFGLGSLLVFFTAVGGGIGLPVALVSWWVPKLRQFAGNLMLACGMIPWLVTFGLFLCVAVGVYLRRV